jgi:hypothetical protein
MRRLLLLASSLSLVLHGVSPAITIRDDVSDATSQALAGGPAYASVGKITRSDNDITSGVLIDQYYFLTAAHIIQSVPANQFTFTIGGLDYAAVGYTISGVDDLAVFQLAQPVLNVTPALIYTGSAESGAAATIVGFGEGGSGTSGASGGRGIKRAATNTIDGVAPRFLAYDFDSGLGADNVRGTPVQTANEGLIAPGDSGGGTFATIGGQTYLIGIHNGVNFDGDSISYNYGDDGVDVRVSAASGFIQSAIPEPGSLGLALLGAAMLGWRRRRT